MRQCTQSSFEFEAHIHRPVVTGFQDGTTTPDAGALLLSVGPVDGIVEARSHGSTGFRSSWLTQHGIQQRLAQRADGLTPGDEDLSDQPRQGPLWNVLVCMRRESGRILGAMSAGAVSGLRAREVETKTAPPNAPPRPGAREESRNRVVKLRLRAQKHALPGENLR